MGLLSGLFSKKYKLYVNDPDRRFIGQYHFDIAPPLPEIKERRGYRCFYRKNIDYTDKKRIFDYVEIPVTLEFQVDGRFYTKITYPELFPSVPNRRCYSGRWSINEYGSDNEVVVAIYERISRVVIYNYGDKSEQKEIRLNEGVPVPELYREGYRSHWERKDEDDDTIIMTAVYEPISITGYVDDIPYATVLFPNTLPEPPKKIGYKGSWPDISPGDEDIVVKASYEQVDLDILYHVGDDFFTGKYRITRKIRFRVVPLRKGHKGHWEREDLDDGTIIMNASYEPIDIIGFVDGLEFARVKYPEKLPDPPSKIGYNGSWPDYRAYKDDIVLEADYSPVDLEVTYHVGSDVFRGSYRVDSEFKPIDVPLIPG